MIKDTINVAGQVTLILTDERGNVKVHETHNLVVRAGIDFLARRMSGTADDVLSHIAVGSNSLAASTEQTALLTQVGARQPFSVTPTVTNSTVTHTAVFAPGVGTGTLREAGLFNALTGGVMFARTTFPAIIKNAADTLTINWSITINAT